MSAVLDFTMPHVLRNEDEYNAAVDEIDHLVGLDPPVGTPDCDRLEFLSVLVEAYEDEHLDFGIDKVTPREVIDFVLDQRGLDRTALYPILGSKSQVSDFFRGERPLSMKQIQALRGAFNIPAELLLPPPARQQAA